MFPNMLDEEASRPGSRDGSERGYEVRPLGHRVHHHHNRVVTCRLRKFDDEVDAYSVPRCVRDRKRMKFPDREVLSRLGPEAEVTAGDILAHVPGHLRPPIIPGNEFQRLPPPSISGDLRIMAECQDTSAQVEGVWDIGLTMEIEDAFDQVPL